MGKMKIYSHTEPFDLESGKKLGHIDIAYHTFGRLNESHSNVIWVCHALTANSDVADWWYLIRWSPDVSLTLKNTLWFVRMFSGRIMAPQDRCRRIRLQESRIMAIFLNLP